MNEKEDLLLYKKTGDLAVLGRLYSPYMSLLYGVCFKYLQDKEQAQDAVMHIFEELTTKLRQHEVDNFKSWLYVYAKNYCLMLIRRNKGKTFVDIDEYLPETELKLRDDDEEKWTDQDINRMHECLDTMQEDQARCLRLFFLEQRCYKDITELTGYTYNQVKSHLQNGKRNLKICMDKKHHGR